MAYRVRWQLVGRSGQPLDGGCVGEDFCTYRDAMAAVVEFLRPYPEVSQRRPPFQIADARAAQRAHHHAQSAK